MSQIEDLRYKRLHADLYNSSDVDMLASTTFSRSIPILEKASDYDAVIEFASIDLSKLILDVAPDYSIMILNDEGGKPGNNFPNLPDYVNVFKFEGYLTEVQELSDWFYEILHKKTLPLSLGTLSVTKNGYFRRQVTQAEFDDAFANGLFKVYVNPGLKRLLPEFMNDSDNMTVNGKVWWALDSAVQDTTQETDTLAHLLKADSIRFYSTLPTEPYMVQSVAMGEIVSENILTTIAINNQTTDILNKTSKRYEPPVYRRFSLVNDQPINSFMVWARIHYTHGRTVMHQLIPGDYMNVQFCFEPRR